MNDPDDLDLLFSSLVNNDGLGNDLLDHRDTIDPNPVDTARLNGARLNGSNRFETSSKVRSIGGSTPLIQSHAARPEPLHTGELAILYDTGTLSAERRLTTDRIGKGGVKTPRKRRTKRTKHTQGITRTGRTKERRTRNGTVWLLFIAGGIAYLVVLYVLSAWWFDRSDNASGTSNAAAGPVAGMTGTADAAGIAASADPPILGGTGVDADQEVAARDRRVEMIVSGFLTD